mgnify:CR=1 FL=1
MLRGMMFSSMVQELADCLNVARTLYEANAGWSTHCLWRRVRP